MSHARPLFLYIRLFNTVDSKFSIYFSADDWIQTMDLWNRKRLLYLLMHNHCPSFDFFVSDMIVFVLINSKFKIKAKIVQFITTDFIRGNNVDKNDGQVF